MADDFFLDDLVDWSHEGWEIVGIVPRTIGTALTNQASGSTFGETWGAGMGGNVVGVYVLLRFTINVADLDAARPIVNDYLVRRAEIALA